MRKIPLLSYIDGLVYAIVDDEDFDILCRYTWYEKGKNRSRYVATMVTYRSLYMKDGWARREVKMHHAVIGHPPIGMDTHHMNGNVLDNRKCNLRFVDHTEHGHISSRQDIYGLDDEGY